MVTECKNCPKCHKVGLPIIVVRYALGLKYNAALAEEIGRDFATSKDNPLFRAQHGEGVPALTGMFKVTDKAKGGAEIPLDGSAQYTLRLPRAGFVYLYNEADPLKRILRCFEVSENGLYTELPYITGPSVGEGEEKNDVACNPEKNLTTAEMITIPYAANAKEVWVGFSDALWTEDKVKQNKAAAYRDRHMTKVDVAAWMAASDPQQEHTACIHKLDPKAPIIAEYVSPGLKESFSFSDAKFNQKDIDVNLEKVRKLLKEIGNLPEMALMDRPGDIESAEVNKLLGQLIQKTIAIVSNDLKGTLKRIRSYALSGQGADSGDAAEITELAGKVFYRGHPIYVKGKGGLWYVTPFEHLVMELDRFYDRAHDGMQKNTEFKGKAMILAVPDPAGIAQDLDGLMSERTQKYGKSNPDKRRLLRVSVCVTAIQASVMAEASKNAANKYQQTNRFWNMPETPEHEEYLAIMEGDSDLAEAAFKTLWDEKYEKMLASDGKSPEEDKDKQDANKQPPPKTKRQKLLDDYAEKFAQFKQTFIHPLAVAHAKWMESEQMANYFICNYDTGPSDGARAQSGGYVEVLRRCVGKTAEQQPCKDLYVRWLTDTPLDEKNLIWGAMCCNSEDFAKKHIELGAEVESLEKNLAAASRQPLGPDGTITEEAEDIVRKWGRAWWAMTGQAGEAVFKSLVASGKEAVLKQSRAAEAAEKAFNGAMKESALYSKSARTAQEQWKRKEQAIKEAKATDGRSHHERWKEHFGGLQKQSNALNENIRIAAQKRGSIMPPTDNAMNHLIWQLQDPLFIAGQQVQDGASSKYYKHVERLVAAHNGTPVVPFHVEGSPYHMGGIMASRSRLYHQKGWGTGATGKMMKGFAAAPQGRMLTSRYTMSLSSDFILGTLTLASRPGYEARAYTEVLGGVYTAAAHHTWGNDSWRQMTPELLGEHARVRQLELELNNLKQGQATVQSQYQSRLDNLERSLAFEHKKLVTKACTATKREGLSKGFSGALLAANVIFTGFALWAFHRQLKKVGDSVGGDDKTYDEAFSMYVGAATSMIGVGIEAGMKLLVRLPVVRNFGWATFLRAGRLLGGVGAGAMIPFAVIEAFWDWDKAWAAKGKKQWGWFGAYLSSAVFGVGAAFLGFFWALHMVAAPVALFFIVGYAIIQLLIYKYKPNEAQEWLEKCYFGKHPNPRYDNDWKYRQDNDKCLEIVDFNRLGIAFAG